MVKAWRVKKGSRNVGGYYLTKARANEAARQTALSILTYGAGTNAIMRARKVRVVQVALPKKIQKRLGMK